MKRVFLLRHAKAAPAEPGQDDSDRPLANRGVADAGRMARYLAKRGYAPGLVLVSPAARTVQTAELALDGAPVKTLNALYLAPLMRLLGIVRDTPSSVKSLMLIGHNPGLEELATLLSARAPSRATWEEKFPTCALAVLDFDVRHWSDVRPDGGALIDFVRAQDF